MSRKQRVAVEMVWKALDRGLKPGTAVCNSDLLRLAEDAYAAGLRDGAKRRKEGR